MLPDQQENYFTEKIETKDVLIGLREDGVIHLYLKDDYLLDLKAQNWLIIAYNHLCKDQKRPMITEGGEFIRFKKEANTYVEKHENEVPILCNAVIAKNTAHFLIGKFFVVINKSNIPIKVFKKNDDAVKWALQIKEDHKKR